MRFRFTDLSTNSVRTEVVELIEVLQMSGDRMPG